MRKFFLFLLALALICTVASAATLQTKEDIVSGEPAAEDLANLVIRATVGAYDEETGLLEMTLYDHVSYKPAEIDALAAGDVLVTDEKEYTVQTVDRNPETGSVTINDGDYANGFMTLYLSEEYYVAFVDDIDYPIYHQLCTVRVPVNEEVAVADFSDPDNMVEGTVYRGLAELLRVKAEREENSIGLDKTNTVVYFDESGKLIRVELLYTPWN